MTASRERGVWFVPGFPSLLTLLVCSVFALEMRRWYPDVAWLQEFSRLLIVLELLAVGAWLVTQLLWLVSDRSRSVLQWAFVGVWASGVLALLTVAKHQQHAVDEAAGEAIYRQRLALRQASVDQARQRLSDAAAMREQVMADPFVVYEGRVAPEVLERMRQQRASMVSSVEAAVARYDEALRASPMAFAGQWERLDSPEAVALARDDVRKVYEAARTRNHFFELLEDRYKSEIEALELPEAAKRYAVAEMVRLLQTLSASGLYDLHETEEQYFAVSLKVLDHLRDTSGRWSLDPADSRIRFDREGEAMTFEFLVRDLLRLSDAQLKLWNRVEQFFPND